MNPIPLTVVAQVQAKSGKEAEMRDLLSSLLAPSRQEVGCLNYDLHQSTDDPARFLFHENWSSKSDLDRHLASAHLAAVVARLGSLVAAPPQITLWSRVG